jgi:hypothetical protein
MEIIVIRPTICQAMNQPGIAVKGEDDGLVLGEEDVEVLVAQSVRMLALPGRTP